MAAKSLAHAGPRGAAPESAVPRPASPCALQAPTSVPFYSQKLLPGDELITTCTYKGKWGGAAFGLAIEDEMW